MHIGSRNVEAEYKMNRTTLDIITDEQQDLGVLIDEELIFHKHVNVGAF